MKWYLDALKKYAVFSGRARRLEFWMFSLVGFLIGMLISGVEFAIGSPGILGSLFSLAMVLPGLAVTVRRLHDTDHSGWWVLVPVIPIIGGIVLLVFMLLDSDPRANRYGDNPKLGEI